MIVTDSELKVLEVLWQNGEMRAADIAKILFEKFNWKSSTTYTVLKKCIEKKWIIRKNPHFVCMAAFSRENVQCMEIANLLDRFFDNSPTAFLNAFVGNGDLSDQDIVELQEIVNKLKKK